MIRRTTQSAEYWENFQVSDGDLDYLSNLLVEREMPLPLDELAEMLVAHRCREEEERIADELAKGSLYLPRNTYEIGQTVVFTLFDYAAAEVVGVRDGYNPDYGTFRVIQARFPNGKTREFAAELDDHPLNEISLTDREGLLSPQELYDEYGPRVRAVLGRWLEANSAFIRLAGEWFLHDLLVEIGPGQLNLAEAVLDLAGGGPLPTEALIGDLDLPKAVNPRLAVFSLNYALQEDARFDEVGPAGEVLWYLRRLEPPEVLEPHWRLIPQTSGYERAAMDEMAVELERYLDDEWSDWVAVPQVTGPVTVVLTFPHRRVGTLPLTSRLAAIFPTGRTHRIRFTFRDGNTGEEMDGWVVREHRFVYGLKEWYERNQLPVGAFVDIERAQEPGVVIIKHRPKRTRRDWVRVVTVRDDRLTFEMTPFPLSCEYDDLMVIATSDLASLDSVAERVRRDRRLLEDVVGEVFPELAKLSPQGTVHAATLYSALNVAVRTPPGPMISVLQSRFELIGDNYWVVRGRGVGF